VRTLKRVTRLSYGAGFIGVVWFIVASPQQIWSIFLTKQLGATSSQLGIIVGLTQIVAFLHITSIYFYSKLKRVKTFWIITTIIHRFLSLGMAYAAFFVYRGGDKFLALMIVAISTVLSLALANTSSAGWFTWMSSLIPLESRASFFGKRSAINQMANVIFFFSITWILDRFDDKILVVYGIIYIIGSILGMLDILFHLGIPEMIPERKKIPFSFKQIIAPLKNRTFLLFCGVLGFSIMAINVSAPFIAPWVVSSDTGLGAPTIWIGIIVVISQTTWVLTAPFWGKVMDRLGKKGVVMIGSTFPLFWLIYLLITPQNFFLFLPLIALLTGLITPAFFDGLLQITYSLADEENQTAYIAWHWASFGIFGAIGPAVGGKILDWSQSLAIKSVHSLNYGIHLNILLSAGFTLLGLIFYSLLKLKETPVRHIIRIVMNPGIFRTMNSISVIEKEINSPSKVENSLRNISGKSGLLAEPEIIERLHDPDRDVREEAAKTLGRIGSEDAVNALISEFTDEDSTVRVLAARSLGRTKNPRAIPFLIGGLADNSDEIKEVCAEALGEMDEGESVENLLDMVRQGNSEKVKVSGAVALSKKGRKDAAEDIFHLMKQSQNRVFRKQLAIALANMLGQPGEFYSYVQGDWDNSFIKLFESCDKLISSVLKKNAPVLQKHLRKELLPSIKHNYRKGNYNSVLLELKKLLMELSYSLYNQTEEDGEEDNLRMLLWFLNLYEGIEAGQLDVLLCFYAIVYGQYLSFM
jgi:MFS family permease